MKHKALLPLIGLLAVSSIFGTTYSAWTSIGLRPVEPTLSVEVPEWTFDVPPFDPGTVIEMDANGNVYIDGELVESEVITENGEEFYNKGDVTICIEADENGNLVLTEFTTSNNHWTAFFGSEVYLPTGVDIDGTVYPVTGVSEPLDINLNSAWFGLVSTTVNIPEGYTYLCDGAFASVTGNTTFGMPSSMESIGYGAFMPARNTVQTIAYAGTRSQWNAIAKSPNYENGQGSITVTYNN